MSVRRRAALLLLLLLGACAARPSPSPSPPPPRPIARESTSRAEALPTIAPPALTPARYLRSLEINPNGYSPTASSASPSNELLLGDLLYHSPHTLGPKAQAMGVSCNTCHPNGATHVSFFVEPISDRPGNVDLTSRFFSKGGRADDGVKNAVSIPSLRGCRFTGPYGHDGRTASLSEFVNGVITGEFDGAPLSAREQAALIRYVQELDFLPNANLDQRGNLTPRVTDPRVRHGAVLFNAQRPGLSGMSCASCHEPTGFFRDGRAHRIGTGSPPSPHAMDGGYETPTLLGLAETSPYFHDGRFKTIAEVIAWFDESFALGMTTRDREDLTLYVEAVGAVDRKEDDRPLARRLDETFAYVSLLTEDEKQPVWSAAIAAVVAALDANPPPAVRARASAIRARLAGAGPSVHEARAIRIELSRLAADWAGAIAAARAN